jgi:hypothetical protein
VWIGDKKIAKYVTNWFSSESKHVKGRSDWHGIIM